MILCKDLIQHDPINSLNDRLLKCPPQCGVNHWVDGRSAKETAKHWLYVIPKEFRGILKCIELDFELCSPEFVTELDNYPGNGRNHDLLIVAKDRNAEKVVVSVESKVDESFGQTIGTYLRTIERRIQNGEVTNAGLRIMLLKEAIFPVISQNVFESLRYQLLTAMAGTIVKQKRHIPGSNLYFIKHELQKAQAKSAGFRSLPGSNQ